jgi:copper(I)-binding protein
MKKIMITLASSLVFFACENAKPKETATTATPETTKPVVVAPTPPAKADTTCFVMKLKKDISEIQLVIVGDDVTGEYHWHPYQKDGGHGTLKGKKKDNMITADWNYTIEGANQTEEVVFKMEGDKLMQAQGELDDKSGKLIIKDKSKVKFSEVFNKVNCATIKLDKE